MSRWGTSSFIRIVNFFFHYRPLCHESIVTFRYFSMEHSSTQEISNCCCWHWCERMTNRKSKTCSGECNSWMLSEVREDILEREHFHLHLDHWCKTINSSFFHVRTSVKKKRWFRGWNQIIWLFGIYMVMNHSIVKDQYFKLNWNSLLHTFE